MDIKWFLQFATASNGVRLITPPSQHFDIECDSSMEGGGGVALNLCYAWKYPTDIMQRFSTIHELEALNLVIAYKTFAPYLTTNSTVIIHTDNQASSFSLQTGKTRDRTLGACARELWLAAALAQHDIDIRHKAGIDIPAADALSRMYTDPLKAAFVDKAIVDLKLRKIDPNLSDLKFFDLSV